VQKYKIISNNVYVVSIKIALVSSFVVRV